jgi:hypothetical protein
MKFAVIMFRFCTFTVVMVLNVLSTIFCPDFSYHLIIESNLFPEFDTAIREPTSETIFVLW